MPSSRVLAVGLVGLEGEKMWSREVPAGQSLSLGDMVALPLGTAGQTCHMGRQLQELAL